jgi:hypothetical protein
MSRYTPEERAIDERIKADRPWPSCTCGTQLEDWSRWRAAGAAADSSYAVAPEEFYMGELSVSPGWKTGGWTRWGLTDPIPRICPTSGTEMAPLLTIATTEWSGGPDHPHTELIQ